VAQSSLPEQNYIITMGDTQAQRRQKPREGAGAGGSSAAAANGSSMSNDAPSKEEKLAEIDERGKIVIWRKPITTLHYFLRECGVLSIEYLLKLWYNKIVVLLLISLAGVYYGASRTAGPHQQMLSSVESQFWWCAWWVWLGILSSVGLGTGLHTFLLYLGPHIASVTLAAYECNTVDFPEPPYPVEPVCPEGDFTGNVMTIWQIIAKVRLEAFMWGAGTALGELPPYFMARGARLSGYDPDDEEMAEFEELQRIKSQGEAMSLMDRAKLAVEGVVERVGFFGILACASIPNPLFDLAGITCGHFLVPFWTFFGATLIGKAVIKMHIQKLFVIIAFNETLLAKAPSLIAYLPLVGKYLETPFKNFLEKMKLKFHRKEGAQTPGESKNILAWLFDKLIMLMVVYFLVSIVNSFAQNYHKRIRKSEREKKIAQD